MVKYPNNQHKDTIFRLIFGEDKKALLSLYNALNNSNYQNPDDLTINTLKDSVYLGMKNDISFIIHDELFLYEHQSTVNPNIPLRALFYISDLYQIITADMYRYSRKLLQIPAPKFVVLYNGNEIRPEHEVFRLSDMYISGKSGGLELIVDSYNINLGHNDKIMVACSLLKEYSVFIGKIKKYTKDSSLKDAIKTAVKECKEENILTEFFKKHGVEGIIMNMLYEYDEKQIRAFERQEGFDDGVEAVVISALKNGKSPEDIASFNNLPLSQVMKVFNEMPTT